MATSVFIAKLMGPLALLLGLAVLVQREAAREVLRQFASNPAIIFLAGLITFPAGLAIILVHNVWVRDWPIVITIAGWLMAFSGAMRLVAPQQAILYGRRAYERPNGGLLGAAIWLVLGGILTFFGYLK